jgi:hypothetical protein
LATVTRSAPQSTAVISNGAANEVAAVGAVVVVVETGVAG